MDPVQSRAIHDVLPPEILGVIFEEHANLEWKAPTIDGQVCRFWRRVVLHTPRAWGYFNIHKNCWPNMKELRVRLYQSSRAPLHIDTRASGRLIQQRLYDLLSGHHTRIVSLRMRYGTQAFFERQDFPCMRLLDLVDWYPFQWGSMPKLQSLRLSNEQSRVVPLSELVPLKMLALCRVKCTSILRHSQTLTTLMLDHMHFVAAISGPVTFPSLTYLSLSGIKGLKPLINAPSLVTYHEDGDMTTESFNVPLPSLVEYGIYYTSVRSVDLEKWHSSFPNIRRLAIRANRRVLLTIMTSLDKQPHIFPALQTASLGGIGYQISKIAGGRTERLVINRAGGVNVVFYFETMVPLQIPIFFGMVRDSSIKWSCAPLTHILGTGSSLLRTLRPQVLACSHPPPKPREAHRGCCKYGVDFLPLAVY